jgi:hypothetical protein
VGLPNSRLFAEPECDVAIRILHLVGILVAFLTVVCQVSNRIRAGMLFENVSKAGVLPVLK